MSEAAAAMAATVPLVIGRYALFDELAAGGMATVHLGRLLGPVGFGRTVAVKRLHAHFLKDEEFITMFIDEARIVARIRHPNVVPMADVVQSADGLFLVMEYVHGESLSRLMRTARKNEEPIPTRIVAAIMCNVLLGLQAAHDTKGTDGVLLGVVHRDVSPQNIIVGADGAARVLDFGIAKAAGRAQITREGQIKGKLAYMAPEQIRGQVDRRTDVFAASVVLWEMLVGRRLHEGSKDVDIVTRVVKGNFQPPSHFVPSFPPELDAVVMRGLATDPNKRHATARELALELERKIGLASPSEVSEWVERLAKEVLAARGSLVSAMELAANGLIAIPSTPPPALAMGAPVAAPTRELMRQHADDGADPTRIHGEVPSSSAVFAHAQPVRDVRPVAVKPRRGAPLAWPVVVVSVLLALLGVGLTVSALLQRAARRAPSLTVVPSARPSTMAPAPTTSATSGAPAAALEQEPAKAAAPQVSFAGSTPGPGSSAGTSSSTGTGPGGTAAPVRAPAKGPSLAVSTSPKNKPNCEPPYTLDEVGHRHYRPECMNVD